MANDLDEAPEFCFQVRRECGESVTDQIHALVYLRGPKALVDGAVDALMGEYPTTEEIEGMVSGGRA
jgi:hypothetical protein